jgi:hypothetical protein
MGTCRLGQHHPDPRISKLALSFFLDVLGSDVQLTTLFDVYQTRPEGVRESLQAASLKLSDADLRSIRAILDSFTVSGLRYWKDVEGSLEQ